MLRARCTTCHAPLQGNTKSCVTCSASYHSSCSEEFKTKDCVSCHTLNCFDEPRDWYTREAKELGECLREFDDVEVPDSLEEAIQAVQEDIDYILDEREALKKRQRRNAFYGGTSMALLTFAAVEYGLNALTGQPSGQDIGTEVVKLLNVGMGSLLGTFIGYLFEHNGVFWEFPLWDKVKGDIDTHCKELGEQLGAYGHTRTYAFLKGHGTPLPPAGATLSAPDCPDSVKHSERRKRITQ